MALPTAFLSADQFTCSICLDVFNNPVSTPCGHSFCQTCISSYWDSAAGNKTYQCPLCKESFRKRPELHINRTLKEITEQFVKIANSGLVNSAGERGGTEESHHHIQSQPLLASSPRHGEMPDSVFAEMMTRFQHMPTAAGQPSDPRRMKGQASVSHEEHPDLPPSYSAVRRYTVSAASDSSFKFPPCPIHVRGLEYYCREDNVFVCNLCAESDHRGHSIVPTRREWNIKKSHLSITAEAVKELISERERKIEEIRTSLRDIQAAAERETDGTVCMFSKLISSVERCQADILEMIEMSRRASEHKAQVLLKDLDEELAELKKRSSALSQLLLSEDYLLFFRTFPAVSANPPVKDRSDVSLSSPLTSGAILRSVSQTMERFQDELRKLPEVCQQVSSQQSVPKANPKVRRVQEYADDITLDPNTAHPRLVVSPDGKQVYCGERHQAVPDNPERFDRVVCVLAREGFSSGRHYWEVEVGSKTDWDLGVASRSISRKGKITVSPAHGYWFLSLRDRTDFAFRTEPSTNLTVNQRPTRIGIYVDCDKGLVSFYNVDARMLIYTFNDTFHNTIHPFFSPCTNKSGRNEAPLIICPVAMTQI
ncbi:zinc finger protein RFP [Synchiropus splendidus]|uniref:zinc finger protein RFP n=1 Tax=Synchiropus splendidus TaxID=270530 RepID=UPI00237DB3EA|nr:zinc finger protein RFP [Synchiropus splendidus]